MFWITFLIMSIPHLFFFMLGKQKLEDALKVEDEDEDENEHTDEKKV